MPTKHGGSCWKNARTVRRFNCRRITTWPAAPTPWTWKTDFAMSRPIVVTVCMNSSSESWEPQQRPHPWHSCAGGGAVHSIRSGQHQLEGDSHATQIKLTVAEIYIHPKIGCLSIAGQ